MTIIKMNDINKSIIRTFDATIELADNAMLRHRPDLFDQWDFEKNDLIGLDVYEVTRASDRISWWKCNKCNEVYDVQIKFKTKGSGCPFCLGRRVSKTNSLASLNPNLSIEWDNELNGKLTSHDVTCKSNKKVWWKCTYYGCSWKATIASRDGGYGCPYCSGKMADERNSLATLNPEIAKCWHPTKNGELSPFNVSCASGKTAWWVCLKKECNSEYDMRIRERVSRNQGCPYCAGKRVNHTNSLLALNPILSSQWHPYKNGKLTSNDVSCNSGKKVWWTCSKSHEWEATIDNRSSKNRGCPYCSNLKVLVGYNDIQTTNPEMAEWLICAEDGFSYAQYSNKKVHWKCSNCGERAGLKSIAKVADRGVKCKDCSDSISTGERLLNNLLVHLGTPFESEKTFEWSENKRYDFYLPNHCMIIEVHGIQHYNGAGFSQFGGRTVQEEQENDAHKELLAKKNYITNYLVIDARDSSFKFIVSSVVASGLTSLIRYEKEIDWDYLKSLSLKRTVLNHIESQVS